MQESHFRAMGSDIHLVVVGGPAGLLDIARDRIEQLEGRWSRFRPDSEVSELNRRAGHPMTVSGDTALLVERAVDAWRLTGGGFDPTVLGAVLDAGYDRSFAELDLARVVPPPPSALLVGCTDITVNGAVVCLPPGTGFDPGGIGKGLAADLVTMELLDAGAAGVCVNMGGDLRVAGAPPDGDAWLVGIEHPWQEEPIALVGLVEGAVATSTTLKRTWQVGGERRHHLIDPATGAPSDSDLDLVSVVAGQAWVAEVLAKAVLLRGSARAFDVIDATTASLTVDHDGVIRTTDSLVAFLGGRPLPSRVEPPSTEETSDD